MRPEVPIPPDLMSNVHVPAWKRLGLKLKYAKETGEPLPSRPSKVNGRPRSPPPAVRPVTNSEPPSKKRRLSPALKQDNASTSPPPSKPERHVSFSADTKLVDGDTARSTLPSEAQDFLNSPEYLIELQKMEQPKPKPQTSNGTSTKSSTSINPSNSTKTKSTNSLDYLTQYHETHDSWSFNKNREVWILKHALSTDDIPTEYSLSLALYVHGIKSPNARSRLQTECVEAAKHLPSPGSAPNVVDTDSKCRLELVTHLQEHPSQLPAITDALKMWLKDLPRVKLLQIALRPDALMHITAHATGAEPTTNGHHAESHATAKLPASKKRKLRTTAIDLSSSSSSSSSSLSDETSSSGSDSDSD